MRYLLSGFPIISLENESELVVYFNCLLRSSSVLFLFLVVMWVGLQCVIVAFTSDTTYFFHVNLLSLIFKIPTVNTICTALL